MSKIMFTRIPSNIRTIGELEVGDTFLRDGAVCMKVQISATEYGPASTGIINLQTGRVWVTTPDSPVSLVDIEASVTTK